jgi:dihydroxyacetone kinase-like predicted kinase
VSDLSTVRELARGALQSLERNRQRIDDLNVYPVPDGDTGTNLTLTARAVVDQLEQTDTEDRPGLVKEVTRAALMGARGNSGVILSQIIRGAAEVLGSEAAIDARVVAQAFQAARDAAYRAVREPVEGTMLSVIRELAEESENADDDEIPELLTRLVRRGEEAVDRTPEQLAVLREAGVVDAGGAGLFEIVRGIAATVTGEGLPDAPFEREELNVDAIHQELSKYRYCTTFMIEGDDLDSDAIEAEMLQLGDSLLVVGDPEALKVHVHTDDPGRALGVGTRLGTIERVEIANMHEQTHQREERLLQALKPSTAELAAAIEGTHADEVIVLPNNSNVILSAEQAAGVTSKQVQVVPTDSIPAGLAAMVAFEPDRTAEANAREMRDLLESVKTGEVTKASRDVEMNGLEVRKGAWLGLADGEAIAGGPDFEEVAAAVAERLLAEPRGLLTLLKGADEPDLNGLVKRIEELHPGLELDVQDGGQPHYPLLLSAE